MTVGEMKKRVRAVLEYVGRIQVEEVTRAQRARMLGLVAGTTVTPPSTTTPSGHESSRVENVDVVMDEPDTQDVAQPVPSQADTAAAAAADDDVTAAMDTTTEATAVTAHLSAEAQPAPTVSKSMQMMDELTRELIQFQEMFDSSNQSFTHAGSTTGGGDAVVEA